MMTISLKNILITAVTAVLLPISVFAQSDLPKYFKIKPETTQAELDDMVTQLKTADVILKFDKVEFNKKGTKLVTLNGSIQYPDDDKTGYAFETFKLENITVWTMTNGKMGVVITARDSKRHPLNVGE